MNSVSQVNDMAQFMRLVSAARTRNSGLVNSTVRNAAQSPRPMSFQNVARSAGGTSPYSSGVSPYTPASGTMRGPAGYARAAAGETGVDANTNSKSQARALGTKFDAYA